MTSARKNKKKSQEFKISVRDSRKDLQSNVLMVIFLRITFGYRIAQVHNRDQCLYQIRSLRKDSGIDKVDFLKDVLVAVKRNP